MGCLRQRRGEIVAGSTVLLRAWPPLCIQGAFRRQAGEVHLTLAGNDAAGVFGVHFAAKGQRLSLRLQRKQRLITNVGVKTRASTTASLVGTRVTVLLARSTFSGSEWLSRATSLR